MWRSPFNRPWTSWIQSFKLFIKLKPSGLANSVYLYLRKLNLTFKFKHVTRLDLEDLLGTQCSITKRLLLASSQTSRNIFSQQKYYFQLIKSSIRSIINQQMEFLVYLSRKEPHHCTITEQQDIARLQDSKNFAKTFQWLKHTDISTRDAWSYIQTWKSTWNSDIKIRPIQIQKVNIFVAYLPGK